MKPNVFDLPKDNPGSNSTNISQLRSGSMSKFKNLFFEAKKV